MVYRLRQFWHGLQAQVSAQEQTLARRLLPGSSYALFARMPVDAQRHSLNVLYGVQAVSDDPDLAAAALLHDAGKVAGENVHVRLGLWQRGPLVLMEAFAPHLLRRLAKNERASGW